MNRISVVASRLRKALNSSICQWLSPPPVSKSNPALIVVQCLVATPSLRCTLAAKMSDEDALQEERRGVNEPRCPERRQCNCCRRWMKFGTASTMIMKTILAVVLYVHSVHPELSLPVTRLAEPRRFRLLALQRGPYGLRMARRRVWSSGARCSFSDLLVNIGSRKPLNTPPLGCQGRSTLFDTSLVGVAQELGLCGSVGNSGCGRKEYQREAGPFWDGSVKWSVSCALFRSASN